MSFLIYVDFRSSSNPTIDFFGGSSWPKLHPWLSCSGKTAREGVAWGYEFAQNFVCQKTEEHMPLMSIFSAHVEAQRRNIS
jgi:hypothetical protein